MEEKLSSTVNNNNNDVIIIILCDDDGGVTQCYSLLFPYSAASMIHPFIHFRFPISSVVVVVIYLIIIYQL